LNNPEDCEKEMFLYGDNDNDSETETGDDEAETEHIVSEKDELRQLLKLSGGSRFQRSSNCSRMNSIGWSFERD
jgi:hypothetical protein